MSERWTPEGAACAWPRAFAVLGLVLEQYQLDRLVRITGAEESQEVGTTVRLSGCWELGGAPKDVWVPLGQALHEWTVLGNLRTLEGFVSRPGPRSCVRCRRVNFGPCISATCTDLQAVA